VVLADLSFLFEAAGNLNGTPLRAVIQNGPQTTHVRPALSAVAGQSSFSLATIRPGAPDIVVNVTSSDPSTVSVTPPQLVFKGGVSSADAIFQPLQPGTANLRLEVPSGYMVDPVQGQLAITAVPARLTMSGGIVQLGRDLQTGTSVSSEDRFSQGASLTVTSGDPSRLLVSTDANTRGQASITLAASPNLQPTIFLQSLADSGTVSVTASADGYQSATQSVQLVPSAAVFQTTQTQTVALSSGAQRFLVSLVTLDPITLIPQFFSSSTLRAGAVLSVSLASSDPKVLSVATPSIQFSAGQPSPMAQVQPVSAGTAIVSLGLLPGGVAPASGGQLVINVK
jgi:hypothetical protein